VLVELERVELEVVAAEVGVVGTVVNVGVRVRGGGGIALGVGTNGGPLMP
jgi:hypothetical protein